MDQHLVQLYNPVLPPTIGRGAVERGGEATGLLLGNLIGGMLIVGFIMALIYLLTGGLHWVTSGGDKANLESARNKIIHSIVGMIVLAAVWAVMTIVSQFLGITFPELVIPSIPQN